MPLIYNVTIEPIETGNRFRITWQEPETNTANFFEQESEITPEERQRMWQWPQCQLGIGQKLFRFLDGDAHCFQQALNQANYMGEPLQVNLWACKQIADWPFELLAMEKTFLLSQQLHLVRRVSDWGKEKQALPGNRPLKLLFMACSTLNVQPELDFEKEEEAIFHITENLAIDMEVEDSGSLEGLRSRLEREEYDVVYLSGHAGINKDGSPYFIMEDEFGNRRQVSPGELWNEGIIENPPRLLFLSGCRTGETPEAPGSEESTDAVSFAHLLVERYNVPAVLGWGRSVRDNQAIHAGKILFHELSRGKTILEAVWRVRYELIKEFPDENKPAWPLLRLFSSGLPLDSIVAKEQEWKPKVRIMTHVYLKNSLVKVLKEGFVGRRRQLQTGLRALKQNNDKVGLLLLGTGGLGKSCLAGKICERFPDHTLIIIHGRFNAITIESALKDAFVAAQDETGKRILAQKIEMKDKLAHLCTTCFKEKNYLLLLDDFEQNLEGVNKGEPGPLLPETADLLTVLFHFLPFSGKMTQLVITSRYGFSLTEQNRDMVEPRLEKVWLTSFLETEQYKKAQALKHILNYKEQSLKPQLLKAGHGNPRLMEWLDHLVGIMIETEIPQLLEAVKNKQEDFIRQHVIRELLQRGGKELELFLRWFSIYRRPVFYDGVKLLALMGSIDNSKILIREGMRLSLIEHDQVRCSYQVSPLLRVELLKGIKEHFLCHEAAFAYYKKICDDQESIDPILMEECIFHAFGCDEEEVSSRLGGKLISHLREHLFFQEAQRVGEWVFAEKKQKCSTGDDSYLLNELGLTNGYIGKHKQAIMYYEQALSIVQELYGKKHRHVVSILGNIGEAWRALAQTEKAIDYYEQAFAIEWSEHGDENPGITIILNNLGLACKDLGEYKKALDYYQQALSINQKVYGELHPNVSIELNNMGGVWHDLGEYKKAIDYYQKALAIDRKIYGEEHPNVIRVLNNLGLTCHILEDYIHAIAYYEEALSINRAVYGEQHESVGIGLNNLGGVWSDFGNYCKAIKYFEQALSIDQATYGESHPNVARDFNNLGGAWSHLENYCKAIEHFEQSLSIYREFYGDEHPNVAGELNNLGFIWGQLGEEKKAINYYEQALVILRTIYENRHPAVAVTLNNIGEAWRILEQPNKAIEYYRQALAIDISLYGEVHTSVSRDLNNLGLAISAKGNYRQAVEYIEKALSIDQTVYGEKHPDLAVDFDNLGVTYFLLGQKEQAKIYFEKANDIYNEIFGPDHPKTKSVSESLKEFS